MRKNIGYGLLQLFFLACFVPVVLTTCQKLPLNPYDPEAVELGFLTDLPVIATDEGTYHKDITVAISCPDPWASVYYTTDGTDPTESSNLYVGPIPVEGDGTSVQIKAVAKNPDRDFSGIISRRFTISYFSLELRVSGNGSVSPSGPLKVSEGGSVTVTATPESGNAFGMWSVIAGSGVVIEDPYDPVTTVTLTTGNGTVQADFAAAHTLTLTTDGNGTTDPAGVVEVAAGYPRTVQALPFAGCVFSHWEDPGSTGAIIQDINRAATSITLTEGDATIEANFIPWPQIDKILASDGAALDYFGRSVAVSDGFIVVGADGDDDAGESSGSAYIFYWDGTDWTEQEKLHASDGAIGQRFGSSVSISGDCVALGAYGDDEIGNAAGSAYIFGGE